MKTEIRDKCIAALPYLASLYYLEIIYLLVILTMVLGKSVALALAFSLAILLSIHLVGLSERNELNRKIQLFLMDIHIAYTLALFGGTLWNHVPLNTVDAIISVIRLVMAAFEIPCVIILTGKSARSMFGKRKLPSRGKSC